MNTDAAIEIAGQSLRQDVRAGRLRDIAAYDRDIYFKGAGESWGEHLYGGQLDTLLVHRDQYRDDIDYTRMVLETIRRHLWLAKSSPRYLFNTRELETAYYGELRVWREQRGLASQLRSGQRAVDLVLGEPV